MKSANLAIFVPVIALASCGKPKLETNPVNPALKADFNYKPGTYWIYRDSISGMIDSFYVTSNVAGTTVNEGANYSVDFITIRISEKTIFPVFPSGVQSWEMGLISDNIQLADIDKNTDMGAINYAPLINYPLSIRLTPARYSGGAAFPGFGNVAKI